MPKVMSEFDTLRAAASRSISRFGDGELRVATGGLCYGHRTKHLKAASELCDILRTDKPNLLVCVPNFDAPGPNREAWQRYLAPQYARLFAKQVYGSAFITRPDSAPWIDTPEYWHEVRSLWRGKDVTLVYGTRKSLSESMLTGIDGAACIQAIQVPEAEAYGEIDAIMERIGTPSGPVLMCCGVAATVLAHRLSLKGIHAIDLGHIGMFMKHQGAYRMQPQDLVSDAYRKQLQAVHASQKWGGDGKKHIDEVVAYAAELQARGILDYGCGRGTLSTAMSDYVAPYKVVEYDPAIATKNKLPKPADLVVCTDVLEHVENDKVENVLAHLYALTGIGAYFTIATRPANLILPNGLNAHLTMRSGDWWTGVIANAGFKVVRVEIKKEKEIALWLRK